MSSIRSFCLTLLKEVFNPFVVLVFMLLSALIIYYWPQEYVFSGTTMGTRYTVQVQGKGLFFAEGIDRDLDRRLAELDATFSSYKQSSELSILNGLKTGEWAEVSQDMGQVLALGEQLFS